MKFKPTINFVECNAEPETVKFASDLIENAKKARKPVFTKKLHVLKDEYLHVILSNEAAFAKERMSLESKHNAIRIKNEKEFNEKVKVLQAVYGI